MVGVNLHGQLIALYKFSFQSKEYNHRMLFYFSEIAIVLVNSRFLYWKNVDGIKIPPRKQLCLLPFKAKIVKVLLTYWVGRKRRGKPPIDEESKTKKIKLNETFSLLEKTKLSQYRSSFVSFRRVTSLQTFLQD